MTTISILGSIVRVDGEAVGLSHVVYWRCLKLGLVYEEWMDKDG